MRDARDKIRTVVGRARLAVHVLLGQPVAPGGVKSESGSQESTPERKREPALKSPQFAKAAPDLVQDPVYGDLGAAGPHAMTGESNPEPNGYFSDEMHVPKGFDFTALKPDPKAWEAFVSTVELWMQGFECPLDANGNPIYPQPDRLTALKKLGEGQWPIHILRYCATYKSLQRMVFEAYKQVINKGARASFPNLSYTEEEIDYAARIAANMLQMSHAAFPDLAGFYDYSLRWKRELMGVS